MNQIAHFLLNLSVLVRQRPPFWLRVLAVYCRVKVVQLLRWAGRRLHQSGEMRFLGLTVKFFDYAHFVSLFEDIFVQQHYRASLTGPAPRIVDAGSNIGLSVLYFKWCYPHARVIAIEPDPRTFALLSENIARNGLSDVQHVNAALSDREGRIEFFFDPSQPGSPTMSMLPDRRHKHSETVKTTRLSALATGPAAMLKLDTEGAEHVVLAEMESSGRLGQFEQMLIEYHHHIGGREELGGVCLDSNGRAMATRLRQVCGHWRKLRRYQDLHIYAYHKPVTAPAGDRGV
jgi:FkbM family methyltransferase